MKCCLNVIKFVLYVYIYQCIGLNTIKAIEPPL